MVNGQGKKNQFIVKSPLKNNGFIPLEIIRPLMFRLNSQKIHHCQTIKKSIKLINKIRLNIMIPFLEEKSKTKNLIRNQIFNF